MLFSLCFSRLSLSFCFKQNTTKILENVVDLKILHIEP